MHSFQVKDHPEANGRKPQAGERAYTLTFPLADGEELRVLCGEETMDRFREMLGSMLLDDEAEGSQQQCGS